MDMQSPALSGVITLIKKGWSIYKAQFRSIILMVLLGILGFLVLVILGFIALVLTSWNGGFIYLDIPLAIAAAVALTWYLTWIGLGLMHLIQSGTQKMRVREALRGARPQVWSYIWLKIVMSFVMLGALLVCSLIAGIIVWSLYTVSHTIAGVVAVIVGLVLLALIILMAVWFLFACWTFIADGKRGLDALVSSKELVHRRFSGMFWRLIGLLVLYIGVSIVLTLVLRGVFSFLGPQTANAVSSNINSLISSFIISPLFLASSFLLYREAKMLPPQEGTTRNYRKWLKVLAIIGAVGMVAIIIGLGIAAAMGLFSGH